jgi:hypothetical protein
LSNRFASRSCGDHDERGRTDADRLSAIICDESSLGLRLVIGALSTYEAVFLILEMHTPNEHAAWWCDLNLAAANA